MRFEGLTPGDHFAFIGEESNWQVNVAEHFTRQFQAKYPDRPVYTRHMNSSFTLPGDARFQQADEILEREPGAVVITSMVRPSYTKIAEYRELGAVVVEVTAVKRSLVELKIGDSVAYLKPIDASFTCWIETEPDKVIS